MAKVAVIHRDKIPGLPSKYTDEELKVVVDMVDEMFKLLGGIEKFIKPGETVVLKPNACTYFGSVMQDKESGKEVVNLQAAANTDARVLAAITKLALEKAKAKEVITAETCAFDYHDRWQAKITLDVSGIKSAVEAVGGKTLDFNDAERVEIDIKQPAFTMDKINVPELLTRKDVAFINVPAMKTHTFETLTLGFKNYQGIFKWDDKMIAHDGKLSLKFVDIAKTLPPRLTVITGIWAVQGQGPIPMRGHDYMTVQDMNTIVAGDNLVATDAVCATIMGFDPKDIRTIRMGAAAGLGPLKMDDIEIVGTPIDKVKRNFIKPSGEPDGVYPNTRILTGSACYVCKALARAMLDGLAFTLKAFKDDPVIFILGKNNFIPADITGSDKDVWVIGDCAEEYKNITSKTHFFPGCTPMNANIELPGTVIAKWKALRAK
ncbi:MAG TPA: DUF362 domain-containing protein [Candidatus Deferrimicrobium sp.]|nr:DUF362 domain-containing protein [Candidatus Deferrimicrobium sp.]